uniref:dUTP diphosphatase n=1 Tax=Mola mola TaxID=94237 RepID=A0A3Q3VKV0_MOLML
MPVLDVTDASAVSPSKRARTETYPSEERAVLRFVKLSEHAHHSYRGVSQSSHCENRHPRMAPRSGLAAKNFIDVVAGVVDEDYRGNRCCWKKGDRVAQLVCERICNPDLVEQETLDETERGAGGFGSIGSN